MFGVILHPQPVGRRRAVAELSVPGVSTECVGERHVFLVPSTQSPPPLTRPPRVIEPSVEPIEKELNITVEYGLKEYLQVLVDFVPIERHRRALLSGKAKSGRPKKLTWPMTGLIIVIGSAAFLYKVNKVGACRFKISSASIERSSKGGTLKTAWPEVVSVLRLSGAYLVQKSNGAMPIPFRCMGVEELAKFERFAGGKLVGPVLGGT